MAVERAVILDNELQHWNQSLSSNFFSVAFCFLMSAVRVLVSGAAGNIGYAILPMIVRISRLIVICSAMETCLDLIRYPMVAFAKR